LKGAIKNLRSRDTADIGHKRQDEDTPPPPPQMSNTDPPNYRGEPMCSRRVSSSCLL